MCRQTCYLYEEPADSRAFKGDLLGLTGASRVNAYLYGAGTKTTGVPPMQIDQGLLDTLKNAGHVLVFTGAGVSAESGIPTFRDALVGLWARFDPAALATREAFRRDPT